MIRQWLKVRTELAWLLNAPKVPTNFSVGEIWELHGWATLMSYSRPLKPALAYRIAPEIVFGSNAAASAEVLKQTTFSDAAGTTQYMPDSSDATAVVAGRKSWRNLESRAPTVWGGPVPARFQLLGAVTLTGPDGPVDLGSPKQRCLLAALLVDAGQRVSVDGLIERVWGDGFPAQVRSALYSYVTRLRGALAAAGAGGLVRTTGGYRLDVPPDSVDLHRFDALVRQARAAGPDAERFALLGTAVDLWRGPPLAGLPGDWAVRVRDAVEQRRLGALVAWADAGIRLGRHDQMADELYRVLPDYPHAEPLAEQLMRALHHGGRDAEALDVFDRVRRALATDLGVDPGPRLRGSQQVILAGTEPVTVAAPPATVPAHLPPEVGSLAGRGAELAELERLRRTATADSRLPVVVVSGPAGVGKTALVSHWARRIASEYPDGQLFVDLRGHDAEEPAAPERVLDHLLRSLGVAARSIPDGLDGRTAMLRDLLNRRRVLLVLDNAGDHRQVGPLVAGSASSLLVVTSRDRCDELAAVHGVSPLRLDVLGVDDSLTVLAGVLGEPAVRAEPAQFAELARLCGGLPLALRVAAARIATDPGRPLAVLAGELADETRRLAALEMRGVGVRPALAVSFRALSGPAAGLFAMLGLHPGPELGIGAVAALTGTTRDRAATTVAELQRAHLVDAVPTGSPLRYRVHDLVMLFARERAELRPVVERRAAQRRLLDFYLDSATRADAMLGTRRGRVVRRIEHPPVEAPAFDGYADALAWFDTEYATLTAAVAQATDRGWHERTWQLADSLRGYQAIRCRWHDWVRVHELGLDSAKALRDRGAQGTLHTGLAAAHGHLHRREEAIRHGRRALWLAADVADPVAEAHARCNLGFCHGQNGRWDLAEREFVTALAIPEIQEHPLLRTNLLANLGGGYLESGRSAEAEALLRRALAVAEHGGDRRSVCFVHGSLARLALDLRQYERAELHARQALALARELGSPEQQGDALLALGRSVHGTDPGLAVRCWHDALRVLTTVGSPQIAAVHAELAGVS